MKIKVITTFSPNSQFKPGGFKLITSKVLYVGRKLFDMEELSIENALLLIRQAYECGKSGGQLSISKEEISNGKVNKIEEIF